MIDVQVKITEQKKTSKESLLPSLFDKLSHSHQRLVRNTVMLAIGLTTAG